LGVAFDGDGDRAIFVDHTGAVVNGDAVLLMCALQLRREGRLKGDAIVATVMSNMGLEIALRKERIGLVRCAVGDKYVMEEMQNRGLSSAAESGTPSSPTICSPVMGCTRSTSADDGADHRAADLASDSPPASGAAERGKGGSQRDLGVAAAISASSRASRAKGGCHPLFRDRAVARVMIGAASVRTRSRPGRLSCDVRKELGCSIARMVSLSVNVNKSPLFVTRVAPSRA
jgi:hypothetical protein